jgi:hypothetical protein
MSRRLRTGLGIASVILFVLAVGDPTAAARRLGRTSYRNKKRGIRIFLPAKWVQQLRAGYPGLLATFHHPDGARLSISARTRKPSETAKQLAEKNAQVLRKRGWTVKPLRDDKLGRLPAKVLEAAPPDGDPRLQQIYAVRGEHAYVLTFAVPKDRPGRFRNDLRYVLKTARFAN